MGQKYETFDVYDYRGCKLKEKLESYLKKGKYIRHCLLQSEQPQLDMPERRGTAYHRRTCHPV